MTAEECILLEDTMARFWPTSYKRITDAKELARTAKLWAMVLQPFTLEETMAALVEILKIGVDFAPNVGKIFATVERLRSERQGKTPNDCWLELLSLMRRFAPNQASGAYAAMTEVTRNAAKKVGWYALSTSQTDDTKLKSEFLRACETEPTTALLPENRTGGCLHD